VKRVSHDESASAIHNYGGEWNTYVAGHLQINPIEWGPWVERPT
jgi:hypothetical protein